MQNQANRGNETWTRSPGIVEGAEKNNPWTRVTRKN